MLATLMIVKESLISFQKYPKSKIFLSILYFIIVFSLKSNSAITYVYLSVLNCTYLPSCISDIMPSGHDDYLTLYQTVCVTFNPFQLVSGYSKLSINNNFDV